MPTKPPAKRGPGRPRKNPLPAPPEVPKTPEADKDDSDLDWAQLILDVVHEIVTERGQPVSPLEVVNVTDFEISRVTMLLDELVTRGDLVLGDDELYRIPPDPADAQDIIGPPVTQENSDAAGAESLTTGEEVTIEGDYDDTLKQNVVYLPSSDIVAFLKNINLPPQLTAGFGIPSSVHGFLAFESSTPTPEDPRPVCKFRVVLYGEHMNVHSPLNPHQPGYVADLTPTTSLTEDPE
jgi:hypothetical protein